MDEFLGIDGFLQFVIKTNNYCNLHCEHCSNNCDTPLNSGNENIFRRRKYELSIEDLTLFCERFKGIGESNFHYLTGAEVTMMPVQKIEEIIEVLDSYKRKISMSTTGYNLMEIDKNHINKIALINLADHVINSEQIYDCRKYLGSFYKGRIEFVFRRTHYELTAAMRHPVNKGKKCHSWMRNPSFIDSVIYPCCVAPYIMLKNNNTIMREELVKSGWTVHNDDIIETMRDWRETLPKYVINQCENNCWYPQIDVGQGGTTITLKKYDIIKKASRRNQVLKRIWEIWDKDFVSGLAGSWLDPKICATRDNLGSAGKHWRLIQKAASLVEGDSVLDVGCGMGHLFVLLRHIDYLGVDSSEAMIEKAHEFFPEDKDRFQLGDAYDLSYPLFDTTIAVGLLLHLPDPEPVIQQLWNRSKICMVFTVWLGETPHKTVDDNVIRRRDTRDELHKVLRRLEGITEIEEAAFHNPVSGESNHFFKVWRSKD